VAPAQTPLGELTALPQTVAGFKGAYFYGRGGEWKGSDGLERERMGG